MNTWICHIMELSYRKKRSKWNVHLFLLYTVIRDTCMTSQRSSMTLFFCYSKPGIGLDQLQFTQKHFSTVRQVKAFDMFVLEGPTKSIILQNHLYLYSIFKLPYGVPFKALNFWSHFSVLKGLETRLMRSVLLEEMCSLVQTVLKTCIAVKLFE